MYTVSRNYYFPKNQIGRYIINQVVNHIDCSVENFRVSRSTNTICVTFSFRERDLKQVERILKMYGLLE